MTGRWGRMAGPDRTVVLAATVARGSAVLLVTCFVALAWPHLRHPGWSLAVAGLLVVESAAIVAWWLRLRRPTPVTLLVDVPVCAAALVASAVLASQPRLGVWVGFVAPYAVVVAFTLGLACRSLLLAVLCGLLLIAAGAGGDALLLHKPLLSAVAALPMLVVNPVVGAASARLLRRGTVELDEAHAESVRRLAEVTAEQERVRYAMALHDRVLQTLETLARSDLLTDPQLHRSVADQAFWLRRYVELDGELRDDDLAARLAALAWQASRETGARVEVNDAGLRGLDAPPVDATAVTELIRPIVTLLGAHCDALVLRAAYAGDAVLVSVLGSGGGGELDLGRLDPVRRRAAELGADLLVEPVPYVELSMPAGVSSRPSDPG